MSRKLIAVAALVLVASAAVLFLIASPKVGPISPATAVFVRQRVGLFFLGNRPFRFVGANVSVMFRDEDRAQMPETMRQAAQAGGKGGRGWGCGGGGRKRPDE